MDTEIRSSGSDARIIPQVPRAVLTATTTLLNGLPISVVGNALVLSSEISDGELLDCARRLCGADYGVMLFTRFCRGDMYRQQVGKRGRKLEWVRQICREYGPHHDQLFRTYAWVAGKWPPEFRTSDRSWDWYKNHDARDPEREPRHAAKSLQCVFSDVVDGVETWRCRDENGRWYVATKEVD